MGVDHAKQHLRLVDGEADARDRLVEANRAAARASTPRAPTGSSPGLDDAELLAAVREGDPDAAGALHDRIRPKIDATVRRLLGAGDVDHEDCVQTTFVEIVRSIDGYRGECSLEHWAAQVAAHVVYKHIRRRRTERRVFDGAQLPETSERVSGPRRLVARDLLERVRRKLDDLDPDKTFAFVLHDVLGFDLREIAQVTGASVAAAQKRLVRGRRDLHAEIARDEELAALVDDLGGES